MLCHFTVEAVHFAQVIHLIYHKNSLRPPQTFCQWSNTITNLWECMMVVSLSWHKERSEPHLFWKK